MLHTNSSLPSRAVFRHVLAALVLGALAAALMASQTVQSRTPVTPLATSEAGKGYWLVAGDGGIFSFGDAPFFGSTGDIALNEPIVGMTAHPDGEGYWFVASDGGIFSFGDSKFHGSMGGTPLNQPIVGMAATPTGNGYWLVASDGGIFSFGDAKFFGSTGDIALNQPIVGMTPHPGGQGYWFVASDGGIFSFGDSKFFGSMGGTPLNQPIVGMAAHPGGAGYWFVAGDGGIFSFGDAKFFGSTGAITLNEPIVGMTAHPGGQGYWFVASDGGIFSFGDSTFHGSMGGIPLNQPIVGMAAKPAVEADGENAAPSLSVTGGPANGATTTDTTPTYSGTAADSDGAVDRVEARVDGGAFSSARVTCSGCGTADASWSFTPPALADGSHTIAFRAVDDDGATSATATVSVIVDTGPPSVTVEQADDQDDPTNDRPIRFTAQFSEPVTGFGADDVTVGGTAPGNKTATVTGSGATYTIVIDGMTGDGTVTASIPAGGATDAAGNDNTASTSDDNTVTLDETPPGVTIAAHTDQDDPAEEGPIVFTAQFDEPVTGFDEAGVTIGGTAGPTTVEVDPVDADTYTISVDGMTQDGTVTAKVDAGAATDAAGNENTASGTASVLFDAAAPQIAATRLTVTDAANNTVWAEEGDELTIEWTEPVSFVDGDTELTEAEVEAILGTGVDYGGMIITSTVTLAGSGSDTWTLTIGDADLDDGVEELDATNGVEPEATNPDVTDNAGKPQVPATGVTFGVGPFITAADLTNDVDGGDWNAVGDELTITWREDASRPAGDGAVAEEDLNAILGTAVTYGDATTVTLAGSDSVAWTLTIGGEDLATGVEDGDDVEGTNNPDVVDDDGNPQVPNDGVTLVDAAGPQIVHTRLQSNATGATPATWNNVGDVLQIAWTEDANRSGSGAVTEAEVEAILGTDIAAAGATTFTINGSGDDVWTITIGDAALVEGVSEGDLTNGRSPGGAADAGGNAQDVATFDVAFEVGPRIQTTRLGSSEDGDDSWDANGETLVIDWNEPASHSAAVLIRSDVEDILGVTLTGVLDTYTLEGEDTATWTITLASGMLTDGVDEGEATNGTNNGDVTDDNGNPQVLVNGVTFDVGPQIQRTTLSANAGPTPDTWDNVGDVMAITWVEAAQHSSGNGTLSEAEVEAILGTAVEFATGSTVTLAGSGTPNWTLTIGGADLAEGVVDGDSTNGTANSDVTAVDDGEPQKASSGIEFGTGPYIVSTTLTIDTDGDGVWNAVGDNLRIAWSEDADVRAGLPGNPTLAQVEAILGVDIEGAGTTFSKGGGGTDEWVLEIAGAGLTTGVAVGDPTNGTNNVGVNDDVSGPDDEENIQVMTEGVALSTGPRIVTTRLTNEEGGDAIWNDAGDELTIIWDKPATHSAPAVMGMTLLTEAQVGAVLGTEVDFGTVPAVQLDGNGTDTWTLTIEGDDLDEGVAEDDDTNGTNNADVEDGDSQPQVPTTGVSFDVGPRVQTVVASDAEWRQNGDVLTITWNEAASHAEGDGALTEAEVEAILGTDVTYGGTRVVRLDGSGTGTWTLTVDGQALMEGVVPGNTTNGTNNDDVTDATGAPQVPVTGVTVTTA